MKERVIIVISAIFVFAGIANGGVLAKPGDNLQEVLNLSLIHISEPTRPY